MTTAAILIIGNEILTGRTQDTNLNWLALELNQLGIPVREARVVPDIEDEIIAAVNVMRAQYSYVFTTGGIGPTHDDITTAAVAKAFNVRVVRHAGAEALLKAHYQDKLNAARLKMADIPDGATLINNPVSSAPGFAIGNVYVMAGVPSIMRAMFDGIKHGLKGGTPMLSRTLTVFITEGNIAEDLGEIANAHPEVDIGSYPFMQAGKLGTSLVIRAINPAKLEAATIAVRAMLKEYTDDISEAA